MIETRYAFIDRLMLSDARSLCEPLKFGIKDGALNDDARYVANCDRHIDLIARAARQLSADGLSRCKVAQDLISSIIRGKVYGALSELGIYDWFNRVPTQIVTQINLPSSEILGKNDCTVDGLIKHGKTYFDVKAFGFHTHMAKRLSDALASRLPGFEVACTESLNIPIKLFSNLIAKADDLAEELKKRSYIAIDGLRVVAKPIQPVSVYGHIANPYQLARKNALYSLYDANQFSTNHPFALIFAIHPYFTNHYRYDDFAGIDTAFTRSLARRTFIQFKDDQTPLTDVCFKAKLGTTLSDASRALSAIFFVNISPFHADENGRKFPTWIYLNPNASHKMIFTDEYKALNIHWTMVDDFEDDNY